jgi:hypothetical protein
MNEVEMAYRLMLQKGVVTKDDFRHVLNSMPEAVQVAAAICDTDTQGFFVQIEEETVISAVFLRELLDVMREHGQTLIYPDNARAHSEILARVLGVPIQCQEATFSDAADDLGKADRAFLDELAKVFEPLAKLIRLPKRR